MTKAISKQHQLVIVLVLLAAILMSSRGNTVAAQPSKSWITYAQFSELIEPLPDSFELAIKNFVTKQVGPISAKHIPNDLIWPFSRAISQYMGPVHPLGIDIDVYYRQGENVVAVADGIITFAGGDICCSYGLYVVVDHGFFVETLYAHLSSINVVIGQKIYQGDIIG